MVIPLLPILHAAVAPSELFRAWHLDPPLTVTLLFLALLYLLARRAAGRVGRPVPPRWRALAFLGGLEVVALALMGPPDHANAVRFSVHMIQHSLLMVVAAPLLALGRPVQVLVQSLSPATLRWLAQRPALKFVTHMLTHPVTAFLAAVVPFVLWHYPPLCDAAVREPLLHELEHAMFLAGSFLFWWVLLDPLPRHRTLTPSAAILLLFAVWMATDLVCATVTLAPRPLYASYVEAGVLWGIDPLVDQRLGGAIMWIGGGGLYAAVLLAMLIRAVRPRQRPALLQTRREWGVHFLPFGVGALLLIPLAFVVFGVVRPVLADTSSGVRYFQMDPGQFEREMAAFLATYQVGMRDGRPVVAAPSGTTLYLLGSVDGWSPILLLERGGTYRILISSGDVAHTFFLALGSQRVQARVVPGTVAEVTISPENPGEYRLLCTEVCGPSFRDMDGLLVIQ